MAVIPKGLWLTINNLKRLPHLYTMRRKLGEVPHIE
jgi:hypothetical protein